MLRLLVKLGLIISLSMSVIIGIALIYGQSLSSWRVFYTTQLNDGLWVVHQLDVNRRLISRMFADRSLSRNPSLSSNQRYITQGSLNGLFISDLETGAQHFFNINFSYRFSPDSHYLLVYARYRFQIIEWYEDGTYSEPQTISHNQDMSSNVLTMWSPNSDMLIFENNTAIEGRSDLYIYSLAQGAFRNLTVNAITTTNLRPAWSPDGQAIAYLGRDRDSTQAHIYVITVDGTHSQRITTQPMNTISLTWSPDGRFLAVIISGRQLYVIPTDGSGGLIDLLERNWQATQVMWSPDSKRLIFLSGQTNDLYMVHVDEGSLTRLTHNAYRSYLMQ